MRLSMGQPPQVGWGGVDDQAQETSEFQEIQLLNPWEVDVGLASIMLRIFQANWPSDLEVP